MSDLVMETQAWPSNAAMIEAAFKMHVYPRFAEPEILDPTFGRGLWWHPWLVPQHRRARGVGGEEVTVWETPARFTFHDYRMDGVDYRDLPHDDHSFDVVAFDPDYVAPGGRDTSTIPDFNGRYGLKPDYESPEALLEMIEEGMGELDRVLRPQGRVLVKCMTYVSGGWPVLGEHRVITAGQHYGWRVADIWVHPSGTGPQPKLEDRTRKDGKPVRQQHARSNSSRLIIFRKPGRRPRGGY